MINKIIEYIVRTLLAGVVILTVMWLILGLFGVELELSYFGILRVVVIVDVVIYLLVGINNYIEKHSYL